MSCHVRLPASCDIVPFAFVRRGAVYAVIPLAPGAAGAVTTAAACSQAVLSASLGAMAALTVLPIAAIIPLCYENVAVCLYYL